MIPNKTMSIKKKLIFLTPVALAPVLFTLLYTSFSPSADLLYGINGPTAKIEHFLNDPMHVVGTWMERFVIHDFPIIDGPRAFEFNRQVAVPMDFWYAFIAVLTVGSLYMSGRVPVIKKSQKIIVAASMAAYFLLCSISIFLTWHGSGHAEFFDGVISKYYNIYLFLAPVFFIGSKEIVKMKELTFQKICVSSALVVLVSAVFREFVRYGVFGLS